MHAVKALKENVPRSPLYIYFYNVNHRAVTFWRPVEHWSEGLPFDHVYCSCLHQHAGERFDYMNRHDMRSSEAAGHRNKRQLDKKVDNQRDGAVESGEFLKLGI